MEARATTRFVRIAPRKARLVADLIRGRAVGDALNVLDFTPKKAAKILAKTLRSAVANAENVGNVDVDDLVVRRAWVDEGPTAKRSLPRAQGRATRIFKRSSHLTVVVGEKK
ncbi:MAG: 50S ribosomal protein L22 [Alphaproteobacteria bacterium]